METKAYFSCTKGTHTAYAPHVWWCSKKCVHNVPKSCNIKFVSHTHTYTCYGTLRVPAKRYIHVGAGIRHLVDWLTESTVRLHVYNEDGGNGLFRNPGNYQTTSRIILQDSNCKATAYQRENKILPFHPPSLKQITKLLCLNIWHRWPHSNHYYMIL